MKLIFTVTLIFFYFTAASAEREVINTDISQIPNYSRLYIQQSFDTIQPFLVKIEKDQIGILSYSVTMENGCALLFNRKGEWTTIDCQVEELPQKAVPLPIWNYIKRVYFQEGILRIEKTRETYKIKLTNKKTIKFDYKFNKID